MQKSQDLRFLKKILTDSEIAEVHAAPEPDATLWVLWACKEAAYKVITKIASDVAFLPRRWSVLWRERPSSQHDAGDQAFENRCVGQCASGVVITPPHTDVPFVLHLNDDFVHCLAADTLKTLQTSVWQARGLPLLADGVLVNPSFFVRQSLLEHVQSRFPTGDGRIEIIRQKEKGSLLPPQVFINSAPADMDISLSHDGRWVAWGCVLGERFV